MSLDDNSRMRMALSKRYSDAPSAPVSTPVLDTMAARGSCRRFKDQPVDPEVIDLLCAIALASPTKSDLQQRDIIILRSASQRQALAQLVSGQDWVADAPMLLVFCGNNRRQRLLHEWHNIPFANDHLDALVNATADAAIALGACVAAADALGLGTCPISAVRNEAQAVSDLLGLPDHVFPFAGLALGYPETAPDISMRLPLSATCHVDTYQEDDLHAQVADYDATRASVQPYAKQRSKDIHGVSENYGWSEDKARQYGLPERADFGAYVRARGFKLD